MSGRQAKAQRRSERQSLGISKAAVREQLEFEATVARLNARLAVAAEQPIARRDNRRQMLALVGLVFIVVALATFVLAGR